MREAFERNEEVDAKVLGKEAKDFAEADAQLTWEELNTVDVDRDIKDIRRLMGQIVASAPGEKPSFYEGPKAQNRNPFKYSYRKISDRQWVQEDIAFVTDALRRERIEKYYRSVNERFPLRGYQGAEVAEHSIVRIDQQVAIANDLKTGVPVLIRGLVQAGKTSMAKSLIAREFKDDPHLYVDITTHPRRGEDILRALGSFEVAHAFVTQEHGIEHPARDKKYYDSIQEMYDRIQNSGKTPFQYWNDYLASKGEVGYLFVDEKANLLERSLREATEHIKGLSNVRTAIILHFSPARETEFRETFKGFHTYFIRPLTLEESATLVRTPLRDTLIMWTDEAIEKLYEFTGGRPFEIGTVCRYVLPHSANDAPTITGPDIERKVEALWSEAFFSGNIKNHYDRLFSMLRGEPSLAKSFTELIKRGEVPASSLGESEAKQLLDVGLIKENEEAKTYGINGIFARRALNEALEKYGPRKTSG